jgi:glycosyltransferase involved in cell wall biosynthesis
MACGTPVITSNLSSLPEVAGDAALLVNPYNTGEITEAMQAVATDSELRSHLRTLSLNQASQFSWEKTKQRRNVDLPEPEGPITATTSPFLI